jgi:hypothetical protein
VLYVVAGDFAEIDFHVGNLAGRMVNLDVVSGRTACGNFTRIIEPSIRTWQILVFRPCRLCIVTLSLLSRFDEHRVLIF